MYSWVGDWNRPPYVTSPGSAGGDEQKWLLPVLPFFSGQCFHYIKYSEVDEEKSWAEAGNIFTPSHITLENINRQAIWGEAYIRVPASITTIFPSKHAHKILGLCTYVLICLADWLAANLLMQLLRTRRERTCRHWLEHWPSHWTYCTLES